MITATASQGIFTNILFPNLPSPGSVQYTTLPPPVDPASKYYPSPLPILVVTEVVADITNSDWLPISTVTMIRTPPAQSTSIPLSATGFVIPSCSSWNYWTPGQRDGTVVAIVIFIIAITGLIWWGFFCKARDRGNSVMVDRDLESGIVDLRRPRRPTGPRRRSSSTISSSRSSSSSRGYGEWPRPVQGQDFATAETPYDPPQLPPPSGVKIRDFAIPAAPVLAAAAGRRRATAPSPSPSFLERRDSRGSQDQSVNRVQARDGSQRRDDRIFEKKPRRSDSNRDRPRARRQVSGPRPRGFLFLYLFQPFTSVQKSFKKQI